MSCYNGCLNTSTTITCSPCASACTGCLEYVSTDCVQFLGTSNSIGFGILQNDSLTTIITKIYAQTASANTWVEMNLPSASTYSTYTPSVTINSKGEVKFSGIMEVTAVGTAITITTAYISSPTYYPLTTKAFIQTYGGEEYLIQFTASTAEIIVTNLNGTSGWTALIDLSSIWYDKNI